MATFAGNYAAGANLVLDVAGNSPFPGRKFHAGSITVPPGTGIARRPQDYISPSPAIEGAVDLQPNRIPDVEGGFRWTMQFRTNVLTSWDGTEQRISTLLRSRDQYEGSFLLDVADDRYIRSLLSRTPGQLVELPMPHEAVAATSAITSTTAVINVTYVDWATIGRRVCIVSPSGAAYSAGITAVSTGTLTLDASPPVGELFPANSTMIYPLESVWLEDGQPIGRYNANAARWNFACRAQSFRQLVGTGAYLTTLDDYAVITQRPRGAGLAQEQVFGGIEFVDAGGYFTPAANWEYPTHRRTHEWLIRNPSERQWWKLFLATTRGRWKPFLCPTWRPDLTPVSYTPGYTTALLLAAESQYVNHWYPNQAYRWLQIEYTDRTMQRVTVLSVAQAVEYDTAYLSDFVSADKTIEKISILERVRLDTDEPAIEYGEGWRGRIVLPMVTV